MSHSRRVTISPEVLRYKCTVLHTERVMKTNDTNPYTDTASARRSAFSTRRGTPDRVIAARAAAARRLGIGYYSPEAIADRREWAQRWDADMRRSSEAEAALAKLFATPGAVTWIVGKNHDVPVAAYLNGSPNVRLCTAADCCDGVLETDEQRAEREAIWAENPDLALGRDVLTKTRTISVSSLA
jgi:hypothetical protein